MKPQKQSKKNGREFKVNIKTRDRKNLLIAMKSSDSSGQCANSKD